MKKLVLSFAIASALGLAGCESESIDDVKQEAADNGAPYVPAGRVVFDPSNGVLSVPNDLLYSGTLDGTLNIPVDDPTNAGDPLVAINGLDGWSTVNPFVLDLSFPEGVELDGASLFNPSSVRIFEAIMGGDLNDADCATQTRGAACKIVGELTYTQDFVTQKSGNSIAVVPLKPLKPKTTYILALTNSIQGSDGTPIKGSSSYELVRQDIHTNPLATESQLMLQGLVNSFEGAIVGAGVSKESIVYTMAMTTQSTADVLAANKAIMANNAQLGNVPTIGVMDTGMSVLDVFSAQGIVLPPESAALYSAANYMQGSISLPYYLGIPTIANPMAPVNDWWKSLCDSGAMLAGLAASNPAAIPESAVSVSDATCMAISEAQGLPAPGLRDLSSVLELDTERHLTKFSPVAAPRMPSDIPGMKNPGEITVQMTTPDAAVASAVRASLGLGAITEPESGWPVVILQHGITSKKEDMLAITGILSVYGFATVAIDHPLHGSRGFDLDPTQPGDEINASTVSATHYMNLASLLTTRDNLRQSTSDMLGLRFGLNFLGGADIMGNPIKVDSTNVHFLGHSLGAITGINFMALTNSPLAPTVDPLFAVKTNSQAMPGVMIANFLLESPAFGDLIKASLTYQQLPDFKTFVDTTFGENASEEQLVGAFQQFFASLDAAQQGSLNGTFAQFVFAAQTVTDSGDPVNYAGTLAATQTPTHLIEVVGNGVDNLADQVIPNTVSTAPLGGTEGAIALLGLSGISETTQSAESPISGAVRYLLGSHSSILSPTHQEGITASPEAAARATAEMQSQVANFFSSNGHLISVQDADIVN